MTEHPTPWRVEYRTPFVDWHEKSRPTIIDADDHIVLHMPQNVDHPGMYDELADKTAHQIVSAVNYRAQQKEWAKQDLENALNPTVKTPRKPVDNFIYDRFVISGAESQATQTRLDKKFRETIVVERETWEYGPFTCVATHSIKERCIELVVYAVGAAVHRESYTPYTRLQDIKADVVRWAKVNKYMRNR